MFCRTLSFRTFLTAVTEAIFLAAAAGAQDGSQAAPGPVRITLQNAQARAAAAGKEAELARLNVQAARYHRLAVQADYFPKIGSTFLNLHYNKFMGQRIQVLGRSLGVPLLDKDQTLVAVTAVQPITPLFKVHEAVRIARADERIAQANAGALGAQVASNVERAYFALLIARRRQEAAGIKVKMAESPVQLASLGSRGEPMPERETAILETNKALASANSQVMESTQSLNALMGLPTDTQLELEPPPPLIENISSGQISQQAIDQIPEVVEAEQTVVKARAALRLSKLEYVPTVAGVGGYTNQNVIPILPVDFSFYGVVASWTVFDFGKRERTVKESRTRLEMAELNLQAVRVRAAAKIQKTTLDLQRTRRLLQLARHVTSMYRAVPASFRDASLEGRAAWADAEADMFQAELDYRLSYAELQRVMGER